MKRIREHRRSGMSACLVVACVLLSASADALVISEIHYNPRQENSALEFVEITNESTTPEDISGYHFSDGIVYEFPAGTILGARESIVVCADVDAVRAEYGIDNAVGDFDGRLDSGGERLTLVDHQSTRVARVQFADDGKWPTEPDGTGHTLVLRDLLLDPGEPESWTFSPNLGGSPGEENFPTGDTGGEVVVLDEGDDWRFAKGDEPFSNPVRSWTLSDFDDSGWDVGASGFGYGDADDETVLGDMRNGYSTVACRASFSLGAGSVATAQVTLAIRYDDGFCAYINGQPFASDACPENPVHDSLATEGNEANDEHRFAVPSELLVAGENVVAILGLNVTIDSTDFSLAPRVLVKQNAVDAGSGPGVVFSELHRDSVGGSWVELFNGGSTPISLAGTHLSTTADGNGRYTIPAGTVIAPNSHLVITEAQSDLDFSAPSLSLFLLYDDGRALVATTFQRSPPPGHEDAAYSEISYPEGSTDRYVTLDASRGSQNIPAAQPAIVINEIFYSPPEGRTGEFLELFNAGDVAVDLSDFRFTKGVSFTFPEGTVLPSGGFAVISDDPERVERDHEIEGVFGPYEGVLSNGGENVRLVDAWGNLVDEVRYWDGGDWSLWADGRGSSLELIDPRQPNDYGTAWADSDESGKSSWERLSYHVDAYRTSSQSELHLILAERGECLIDDVEVRRRGGSNHISNSGFESRTSPWRIEGNHVLSERVTFDARSGNACLALRASGKGDSLVNRIETDTSPALSNGEYDVSLWARWLRGATVLIGHGEFSAGPWGGRPGPSVNISGNTLGGSMRLTVPANLGTPGAVNSRFRANDGPVIANVSHLPASPDATTPVEVSADLFDVDGVASASVFYREGDANGAFQERAMSADSGSYRATIPAQSQRSKIVFYVEATDSEGVTRRYPESAPERTLLYQVVGESTSNLDSVSLMIDDDRLAELTSRRLHSNHLVDGTYVFQDQEIHYNVGMRYRGSPWGRPERSNYRVRFPKDQTTHVRLDALNISSRANGAAEAASHFLVSRAGTSSKPVSAPLYRFVNSRFNGSSQGTQRMFQPVDGSYIGRWFPGSDGPVLKAVARLQFNDSGQRSIYDAASFDYMGTNPENYRFYYYQVLDRSRDDWDSFMELMRVMDPRATSTSEHDREIDSILDVEGFLRVMVGRVFVSDWDTLGIGQGHNAYLALDSTDGRWETIPFDFNQAMPSGQVNFPVFPTWDRGWARLISRPAARRTYVRIANEFLDGYWSTQTARPYLDAMERDTGVSMSGVRSFVSSRATVIRREVASFTTVDFRIITGSGSDIDVDEAEVSLVGEAPAHMASIIYSIAGESFELEPTWQTPTRWAAVIPLHASRNDIEFFGFDESGGLVDSTSVVVTSSADFGPRFVRGDANGDAKIDLSDAVQILLQLFNGAEMSCADASDADDDSNVTLTDSIYVLEFLFRGGAAPPLPFPQSGEDSTEDALGCVRSEN